jgi:putative phosphoesterase
VGGTLLRTLPVTDRLCGGSVGAVRVAAISDIHGNLPALEAVLEEIEREDVDEIVVAGDTAHGPWPAEVVDLLVERGARCVRGNADREVIERSDRFGPLAQWSADRLGESRLAVARSWPLTVELSIDGLGATLVCHSTPASDDPIYTRITPDAELVDTFESVDADVLVCGHTHMQYDRTLTSGLRVVNPGSVGMPYEGAPGAYWALLGPDVEFRRTEYDVEGTVAAIEVLAAPVYEGLLEQLVDPPDSESTTEYFESHRGG